MSLREASYRELYPLAPVYELDEGVMLKSRTQTYKDGYTVALSPLLNQVRDITMNKKNLLMLTNTLQLSSIFDISTKSLSVENLYFKSSLYTTDAAHYYIRVDYETNKLFVDTFHPGNDTFFLFRSVPYPFSYQAAPVIQLWVSRPLHQATKTGLLTVSRTYPYELTIQDPIWADGFQQQRFDYFRTGNVIQLRSRVVDTNGAIISHFIGFDVNDGRRLKLGAGGNYDFVFQSPDNTQMFDITNYDGTTYWIKYHNDLLNQKDNKSVEIDDDTSIKGVPINLLVSSPYETLKIGATGGDIGSIPKNLNVLKNFQTPEYNYTDNDFYTSHYRINGKVLVNNNHIDTDGPMPPVETFAPLANVAMHGFPTTVVTDASGNYSALVNYDFSGAVYPDAPNYLFSPSGLDIFNLNVDTTTDFLGTLKTIPVSGHIVDTLNHSLSGVKVITSSDIPPSTTDSSGNYVVNVPWNWNGVVALSASFVSTFTPPSAHLINVTDTVSQNFAQN